MFEFPRRRLIIGAGVSRRNKVSVSISEVPSVHRAHRWFLSRLGRFLLYLSNWKAIGAVPQSKKLIVIGAPHSSFLDAYYVLMAVWALDVRINFLGAAWMFSRLPILDSLNSDNDNPDIYGVRWPLGWLQKIIIRRLGGIPVYRSSPQGTVEQLAETIERTESVVLMMAPEGGMVPTERFKSGFYVLSTKLKRRYGERHGRAESPFRRRGGEEPHFRRIKKRRLRCRLCFKKVRQASVLVALRM